MRYLSTNVLTVKGSLSSVKAVKDLVCGDHEEIWFDIAVPFPKALNSLFKTVDNIFTINKDIPKGIGKLTPAKFIEALADLNKYFRKDVYIIEDIEQHFENNDWFKPRQAVQTSIERMQNHYLSVDKEHADYAKSVLNDKFVTQLLDAMQYNKGEICDNLYGTSSTYTWLKSNWGSDGGWNHIDYDYTVDETNDSASLVIMFEMDYAPPFPWFYPLLETVKNNNLRDVDVLLEYADKITKLYGSLGLNSDGESYGEDHNKDNQNQAYALLEKVEAKRKVDTVA
ncbi:hypothetical protein [uncultured Psychrobacter sp.]|uniref:hypothetical protein n=1 Tax=uncultured Psychrobacter sp. TaxID=259303 RepID=UPI0030D6D5F1